MNRFPDHARVAFIGDSITANGLWIAHIFDHYLKHFPDADIRMYNTGISGGSARSALMYFEDNIMVYRPTHAVIMLGMNDVGRDRYAVNEAGDYLNKNPASWLECLEHYEAGMRELTRRLLERNVQLTFVTPTCYDESTLPRALDKVGCDAALEYAGELCRRLAAETGSDFINLHAPLRLLNAAKTVIRDDRVHPVDDGHVLMAQLFLHAQGLAAEPTLAALDAMPAPDDLLPVNQTRREAEAVVRRRWNIEWLVLRGQPEDVSVRMEFLKTYEPPTPYFETLRQGFYELSGHEDEIKARELECIEACLDMKK